MTTGFGTVLVPDRSWRCVPSYSGYTCRFRGCGRPAVAQMLRGRKGGSNWWSYCECHLYGRVIVDGVVMHGVQADSPAAQRGYSE